MAVVLCSALSLAPAASAGTARTVATVATRDFKATLVAARAGADGGAPLATVTLTTSALVHGRGSERAHTALRDVLLVSGDRSPRGLQIRDQDGGRRPRLQAVRPRAAPRHSLDRLRVDRQVRAGLAMDWQVPTLADVLEARIRIAPYLRATPLFEYPALSELVGAETFVKHENHQPVGAFKVRGGVNLISQLDAAERERGVIASSTGNHGQSIAFAARLFAVPATICVPEGANPVKVASMRALGAEVIEHGRDFDDAREHCERLAVEHGFRYVHSGNEPHLIAGVATADARDPRAGAAARRHHRPDRRWQRRGRRVHRRQGAASRRSV